VFGEVTSIPWLSEQLAGEGAGQKIVTGLSACLHEAGKGGTVSCVPPTARLAQPCGQEGPLQPRGSRQNTHVPCGRKRWGVLDVYVGRRAVLPSNS